MIKIKHNIIGYSFRRKHISPKEDNVPCNFFRRLENEKKKKCVTRTLDLSQFDDSKRISMTISKVATIGGSEFIRYYKFEIHEEKGKSGTFKDEYVFISITGGDIKRQEVSEFVNLADAQESIVSKAKEDSKKQWDNITDKNANTLYKSALYKFYEIEYDCMASDNRYSTLIQSYNKIDITRLYADGIRKFVTENNLGIIDNTQRLLDEVRIQNELYNVPDAELYLTNCKLFLKQCPNDIILKDAFAFWWNDGSYDFLWDTRLLDCRFSVGIDESSWRIWVGVNNHSSDDETYVNGIGGDDIDEKGHFADVFFETMNWHVDDM